MNIEYIAISRHWFDKRYGNSYFSAQVFNLDMKLLKVIPFQYGSDEEHIIASWVQSMNPTHEHIHDVRRKIYFDKTITLKRDCEALGSLVMEEEIQNV